MSSNEQRKRPLRNELQRSANFRVVQNFLLVWLDRRIDEIDDEDFDHSISQLRRVVNTIETFNDTDQCIDFITEIKDENVLMIISGELGRNLLPLIHCIHQITSIYIFCINKSQYEHWSRQWRKIKGIYTDISQICQTVREDARKCDQNAISISFVGENSGNSKENLDQLDPTYMYTQILKEVLLKIDFNDEHLKDFTEYYRKNFISNNDQLKNIDEFEKDYKMHNPIWWYTHQYSFYSILNRALRLMEVDTIIQMGFFIQHVHQQINKLHLEQFGKGRQSDKFTVYRGQGLSKIDLEKIIEIQGGLISFNNFLSTTKELSIAYGFADSSLSNNDSIGIVFVMTIDPSIRSTPFASIDNVSFYKTEEEILFSMHTVFRIDQIIQTRENQRIWQVDLIQTNDNDQQLNQLTRTIRKDIEGRSEWERLAQILVKLSRFDKVDQLYQTLLDQAKNDREKIHLYNQLGWSNKNQQKYPQSIQFYEKALEIKEKLHPPNHHSFTISYNDLGSVYEKMEEYTKALLYYEQALDIEKTMSSTDEMSIASCFSKIGSVYEKIQDYSKALQFHQDALQIRQKINPPTPHLAYCYQNLASVYEKLGDYSEALSSHKKCLSIQQEILHSHHSDIAQSYSNIGRLYGIMRQYTNAQPFHQKAVDIGKRSLPSQHPKLVKWIKSLEYNQKRLH